MRKILLLGVFLLNLLPMITHGFISTDALTASAQTYGSESYYECEDELGEFISPIPCDEVVIYGHKCDICDKCFETEDELDIHMKEHRTTYECQYCHQEFNQFEEDSQNEEAKNNHEETCPDNPAKNNNSSEGQNQGNDPVGSGGESSGGGGRNSTGGNNKSQSDNNDPKETLRQKIEHTKRFGNSIYGQLQELEQKNRIREATAEESLNRGNLFYYRPSKSILIHNGIDDYGEETLIHELVHYEQDLLQMLKNECSSNNEFQAYITTFLVFKSTGDLSATPFLYANPLWEELIEKISNHIWVENGYIYYDETFLEVINNADWNSIGETFRSGSETLNYPSEYYNAFSSTYNYNWETLLQHLGAYKK